MPERPRALLEGADSQPSRCTQMRRLMAYLRDTDDTAYLKRSRELAFLANTLMAGCSVQGRSFTAQEASDAAVAICNLGLEHWPARWPDAGTLDRASAEPAATLPETFLAHHDLVTAFEVGWAVLHEDVSLFVAEHLIATLRDLRCVDAEIQEGLHTLRRELVRQRDAGTPWRARAALDVLVDARYDRLGRGARTARRMSGDARGGDGDPRGQHQGGERDGVRVHLDGLPDSRCSGVHAEAA